MKICIDAGHGGKFNNATSYDGVQEKTENLTNALALQAEMQRRGHTVIMTRTTDTELAASLGADLNKRCEIANSAGCDCFVSCHENGYSDPDANGTETIHGTNASAKSKQWAADCLDRLAANTGLRKRSVLTQGITVLTKTKMPAILVEFGFMTNVGDMTTIRNNRAAFIGAIADSAEAMFGAGTQQPAAPTPQPEPQPRYEFALTQLVSTKSGSYDEIKAVQRTLNDYGYGLAVDGIFGSKSKAAVMDFQGNHGLKADGVVGKNTCEALNGRWDG